MEIEKENNNNENIKINLSSFNNIYLNYISLKSSEKFLNNLISDNLNCNFNTEEIKKDENISLQFDETAQLLIQEIIEYRKELQRRDQLKEEAALPTDDIDLEIENENEEEDLMNIQDELDQIEQQLAQYEQESNLLNEELEEQNEIYEATYNELQSIQNNQPVSSTPSASRIKEIVKSAKKTPKQIQEKPSITDEDIKALETQEEKLSVLLEGLEKLYQIKVVEVKYINCDFTDPVESSPVQQDTTGLSITLSIKQNLFTFLLDSSNKLYDIQVNPSNEVSESNSIDIMKLLFECVQFTPPYDIKYAIFVILSSYTSAALLEEHIRVIQKKYLINHVKETKRIHITLKSGITAVLRVHDCYPYVPNGVYLESLHVSGEWSKEELTNAKKLVNGMCPTQLQDTIDKLLEVLGD